MKRVLVGLVVLLSLGAIVQAAEVATTVDLTYTTKYLWRGFDKLDNVSAWQPSVNFDFGNGFSANVFASYAGSGGMTAANSSSPAYAGASRVNLTEYQYTLAYGGTMNEGCPWRTNYSIGYRYFDYIDTDTQDNDIMEVFVTGEMPDLIEGGVVPHFGVFQVWPAQSGADGFAHGYTGTIYLMGFNYGFTLDSAPELPMTFSWDIVYNDGTGGTTVDHDWSHMVWGLTTSMDCPATGGKLTPGIYFQNSFEDTVNTQDEYWASLSYSFSF